jgi:hypothetical protein
MTVRVDIVEGRAVAAFSSSYIFLRHRGHLPRSSTFKLIPSKAQSRHISHAQI